MTEIQQVLQAQAATEAQLLAKQNVVGVAVGFKESEGVVSDQLAVMVLVQEKKPVAQLAAADVIPKSVDGVRTDVYEVGDLRAQLNPKERFRPTIPAGVSSGHYRITAGTLGAVVRDRNTGEPLLLSNNHVFGNSNDGVTGDAILQPGPLDNGQNPADMIARLERFVPLRFIEDADNKPDPGPTPIPTDPNAQGCLGAFIALANVIASLTGSQQRVTVSQKGPAAASASAAVIGTGQAVTVTQALTPDNAMDAAVARPLNPAMFEDNIVGIGKVSGTKPVALGMTVRKSGRTTGLTQARVTLLNATINITYDTSKGARTARFTGQVLTEAMSQGGDSGSLVVDGTENKAVGLLFAGSPVATVFTPIDAVLVALNVVI